MEDFYSLPVTYNGEELEFKARPVATAYQIQWLVIVDAYEITFERDDEMNYRAVAYNTPQPPPVATELLAAIAATLQQIDQAGT